MISVFRDGALGGPYYYGHPVLPQGTPQDLGFGESTGASFVYSGTLHQIPAPWFRRVYAIGEWRVQVSMALDGFSYDFDELFSAGQSTSLANGTRTTQGEAITDLEGWVLDEYQERSVSLRPSGDFSWSDYPSDPTVYNIPRSQKVPSASFSIIPTDVATFDSGSGEWYHDWSFTASMSVAQITPPPPDSTPSNKEGAASNVAGGSTPDDNDVSFYGTTVTTGIDESDGFTFSLTLTPTAWI